ncbi:MAG: nucleotidyl transferase AbiEii/AbiGii toxin family protein [Myxococcales bacterium]|nr:nucleotidyl transferase AbiEii/AbiGii toxin family protein [Myxococcales bacterium]
MRTLVERDVTHLAALRRASPTSRVVLIGAAALGLHVELPRTTVDVDLVMVLQSDAFDSIAEALGWSQDPRLPIRFHGRDGFRADVLSITLDDLQRDAIEFADDRTMSLLGFDLVLAHATPQPLDDSLTIDVANLPTLALLKMVAWLDRPDRQKDLADLGAALEGALEPDDERRWDRSLGLPDDYRLQSAFFLGQCLARVAETRHREVVERFLARMSDRRNVVLLGRAAGWSFEAEERAEAQLASFREGFSI